MSLAAKPILAEPDQRYWRRKANRRVRKARMTRSFGRWSLMALAFGVVGVALFQASSAAVDSRTSRFSSRRQRCASSRMTLSWRIIT